MKTRLLPALAQVQIQKQRDVGEDLIRGIKIIENRLGRIFPFDSKRLLYYLRNHLKSSIHVEETHIFKKNESIILE